MPEGSIEEVVGAGIGSRKQPEKRQVFISSQQLETWAWCSSRAQAATFVIICYIRGELGDRWMPGVVTANRQGTEDAAVPRV